MGKLMIPLNTMNVELKLTCRRQYRFENNQRLIDSKLQMRKRLEAVARVFFLFLGSGLGGEMRHAGVSVRGVAVRPTVILLRIRVDRNRHGPYVKRH